MTQQLKLSMNRPLVGLRARPTAARDPESPGDPDSPGDPGEWIFRMRDHLRLEVERREAFQNCLEGIDRAVDSIASTVNSRLDDVAALVTELGILPRPPGTDQDEVVEVIIRPDDISIRADNGGSGIVVDRVFQGTHYLYTVRLPSGMELHAFQPHYQTYALGSEVAARLDPGHALMCFARGELRTIPLMGKEP